MSLTQYLSRQSDIVQRAIAVLLLVLLGIVVTAGLREGLPWLTQMQSQWRKVTRAELATLRGWVASAPELSSRRTQLEQSVIWKQFHVANQGSSVRDVVQQEMNTVLAAVGSAGLTMQPLEPVNIEGLVASGVRVTLSANIEQLSAALAAIRAHSPYLRVQRLEVTAPQVNAPYENPTMLAVLEVVGFSQDVPLIQRDAQ